VLNWTGEPFKGSGFVEILISCPALGGAGKVVFWASMGSKSGGLIKRGELDEDHHLSSSDSLLLGALEALHGRDDPVTGDTQEAHLVGGGEEAEDECPQVLGIQ
jgi:hypothetical protein